MDAIEAKPELIKPSVAAADLTISLPTLRKLGERGVLTQVKYTTKCVRYLRSEVDQLRQKGAPIAGAK